MKLLIISGGSKGLGYALCKKYLARGFNIVEFSRTAPHPFSVKVDFSSEEASSIISNSLSTLAAEKWGEVIVFNNAGTLAPIGKAMNKDYNSISQNIKVNFTSSLFFMIECIKQFQHHRSRKVLVNISSGAALKGYHGWSLYCAAKAGTENFIRSIALEQSTESQPFIAISVDPGLIDTDMQASIRKSNADDFPAIDRFIQRKESGVLRQPQEVAEDIMKIMDQKHLENGERLEIQW